MAEDTLTVTNIPGLDGTYPFDFDTRGFTNGELHTIKTVAGVRAGEIEEAFAAGDNDLLVALAMIVMARHGKVAPVDALWAAPAGAMAFAIGDRPEDAEEALLPPPKLPAAGANDSETKPPSGTTSSGGGALQESGPPAIGTRG